MDRSDCEWVLIRTYPSFYFTSGEVQSVCGGGGGLMEQHYQFLMEA